MADLAGKVVVITAAAQGIGKASALAFARTGATVHATDINETLLAELAKTPGIKTRKLDVLNDEAVNAAFAEIGRVDVLFNCAGFVHSGSILEMKDGDLDFAFNLNVRAMIRTIRAVLPGMLERGRGDIVNVSSGAALRPLEGWSAYCAGKAGLAMLTRSIDLEHRAGGIRVFGFQPGTTDTDMQVAIRASGVNVISQIPREQLTPVAHPARAIVYLCTQAADDLAGKEFSLRDEEFQRRIGLG